MPSNSNLRGPTGDTAIRGHLVRFFLPIVFDTLEAACPLAATTPPPCPDAIKFLPPASLVRALHALPPAPWAFRFAPRATSVEVRLRLSLFVQLSLALRGFGSRRKCAPHVTADDPNGSQPTGSGEGGW